jgi:hypothetical protein
MKRISEHESRTSKTPKGQRFKKLLMKRKIRSSTGAHSNLRCTQSMRTSRRELSSNSLRTRTNSFKKFSRRRKTFETRTVLLRHRRNTLALTRLQEGSLKRKWLIGRTSPLMNDFTTSRKRDRRSRLRLCWRVLANTSQRVNTVSHYRRERSL